MGLSITAKGKDGIEKGNESGIANVTVEKILFLGHFINGIKEICPKKR